MSTITDHDITAIVNLLKNWIQRQTSSNGWNWLEQKQTQISQGAADRVFFTSFSAVPRYLGKADLQLTTEDLKQANILRSGWSPDDWSLDRAGRAILILSKPHQDAEAYKRSLENLFNAADVAELVALYQSLPILPHPEKFRARGSEGIRSNITTVFNAVALNNPYPADYFDELAWNQMVLKSIFVASPLHLIYGLDRRANPKLAQMLSDYAHERWAAKRTVTPELWRPVGPFVDEKILPDLERLLKEPDPIQQEAGALACSQCPLPEAKTLLSSYPHLQKVIEDGSLSWESFSENRLGGKS